MVTIGTGRQARHRKELTVRISIFGLGYVGCVGAACCAKLGHRVIGVDVTKNKVDLINAGRPTIIEAEINDLVREGYEAGLLEATQSTEYAVLNSDISFIAVGTPSTRQGHLKLDYIFDAARGIGKAIAKKDGFHVVAIRSTVLPGTNANVAAIIEDESGKKEGIDFAMVSNPEFLREGTAVRDYLNPPVTVVGSNSERAVEMMRELYSGIDAEFVATDVPVAEIMKYVCNTYHGLKIVFANEVGNICKALGIDSHKVMDIFCKDRQLNISSYYFKPGFAYGGSCLPKDSKALRTLAHDNYVDVPVINAINPSNELQKKAAVDMIVAKGRRRVGVLGLSFKPGTDDLRCSPIVDVIEALLGKGFQVSIYDRNVKVSAETNTNEDFIMSKIPYMYEFVTDNLDAVCDGSDVLVVTNREKEFADVPERFPGKIIIDLARMWDSLDYEGNYEGISWGNINVNAAQEVAIEADMARSEF